MFWLITLLFVFFCFLVIGLWLSKQASNIEKQNMISKSKTRQIKLRLNEIDHLISTLLVFDANPALIQHFYQYNCMEAQKIISLDDSEQNQRILTHYQNQLNELSNLKLQNAKKAKTDQQINALKKQCITGIKLLKKCIGMGICSEIEGQNHIERLRKIPVTNEINALIDQGQQSEKKGENLMAIGFYKHAKELLINTDIDIKNRTEKIKSIAKKISQLHTPTASKSVQEVDKFPLTTIREDASTDQDKPSST